MYKVGGLFSGVGGIEKAFEDSGFEIKWSIENDSNACKTYRKNFPNHNLIEKDVWWLCGNNFRNAKDDYKLDKVDILVAGFPCQAFSVAGYRKGFGDERGNLFFAIEDFIRKLKPKSILLENVKNLHGHDKGKTFKRIHDGLDALGYSVIHKVLNTAKYTDIPQNRERIFIIGFRNESDWNNGPLIRKTSKCKKSSLFSWPDEVKKTKSVKKLFDKEPLDQLYYYDKKFYKWKELISGMDSEDTLYQWRRVYPRKNMNNHCPTLTANMGTGGHNVPLILVNKSKEIVRKLTPKECFRFQGFNNIKLPSDVARSQLYKQAGNSVTVTLVSRLAKNIKTCLDSS